MAGDNELDTKYCHNCKRDIALVNFVMHEVHCHKNIVLCQKCKEPVARSELECHEEEEHTLVNCELCGTAFERSVLEGHMVNCPKRKTPCPYCEMECIQDQLEQHMEYCGTRTEACVKCLQYVMQKDLARHEESNCTYPQPNKAPAPQQQSQQQQEEGGAQYLPLSGVAAERMYRGENLYFGGDGGGLPTMNSFVRGELGRLGHEPNDRGVEERSTYPRGRGTGRNVVVERNPIRSRKTTNASQEYAARGRGVGRKPPPPNDRKTIPDYKITEADYLESASSTSGMDHALAIQLAAGLDLNEADLGEHMLAQQLATLQTSTASSSDSSGPGQPTQLHRRDSTESAGDSVMLPCENCGGNFPLSLLLQHQNQCAEMDAASSGSRGSPVNHGPPIVPGLSVAALNNSGEGGVSPSGVRSQPQLIDNLNGRDGYFASGPIGNGSHSGEQSSEVLFPCEFCEQAFPEDMLLQHQSVCDSNPFKTPRVMTPKVNNQRVDPSRRGALNTYNAGNQRSRNSPGESNSLTQTRGSKKVPNISTTPTQRKVENVSKTTRILDDFRANPSYSPLNLHGNPARNESRNFPISQSGHGNRFSPQRGGSHSNMGTDYRSTYAREGLVGNSIQTRPNPTRSVPRTSYNTNELGSSGASLRAGTTERTYGNNTRGGKFKRPQREV